MGLLKSGMNRIFSHACGEIERQGLQGVRSKTAIYGIEAPADVCVRLAASDDFHIALRREVQPHLLKHLIGIGTAQGGHIAADARVADGTVEELGGREAAVGVHPGGGEEGTVGGQLPDARLEAVAVALGGELRAAALG